MSRTHVPVLAGELIGLAAPTAGEIAATSDGPPVFVQTYNSTGTEADLVGGGFTLVVYDASATG